MGSSYRHTQIGYLMIVALGAGVLGLSAVVLLGNAPRALLGAIAVLAICLFLFPTLTAIVRRDRVRCFFGIGLIRRDVLIAQIAAVTVVRNPWSYGWGLRLIPGGWWWNVSGLDAVELRLRDGKLFRIGSDEPQALRDAIVGAMNAR